MRTIFVALTQLAAVALGDLLLSFNGIALTIFITSAAWTRTGYRVAPIRWSALGALIWTLLLCLLPTLGHGALIARKTAAAFNLPHSLLLVILTILLVLSLTVTASFAGTMLASPRNSVRRT